MGKCSKEAEDVFVLTTKLRLAVLKEQMVYFSESSLSLTINQMKQFELRKIELEVNAIEKFLSENTD